MRGETGYVQSLNSRTRGENLWVFTHTRILTLPLTYQSIDKLFYLQRMFNLIQDINGDAAECGGGQGHSLLL